MMNMLYLRKSAVICVLQIIIFCSLALAGSFENIQLLKISPQDQRAVVKMDGKMRVIKVGEVLRLTRSELPSKRDSRVTGDEDKNKVAGYELREGKPVADYELRVVEIVKDRVVLEEKKGEETTRVIIRVTSDELRDAGSTKQKVERIKKAAEKTPEMYIPAVQNK